MPVMAKGFFLNKCKNDTRTFYNGLCSMDNLCYPPLTQLFPTHALFYWQVLLSCPIRVQSASNLLLNIHKARLTTFPQSLSSFYNLVGQQWQLVGISHTAASRRMERMEVLTLTYLLLKVDYATFNYGIFHIHGTFSYLLASLYISKVPVQRY